MQIIYLCLRYKIAIVHAHSGKAHGLGLIARTIYPKFQLVVHRRVDVPAHGNFFAHWKYNSKKVAHWIAISHLIKKNLVAIGIPDQKITVIPSAIAAQRYFDLERDQLRSKLLKTYNIPHDALIVGLASRLSKEKNIGEFLTTLVPVAEFNFVILIAGTGSEELPLKQMAARIGFGERLQFIGFVANVPEFLGGLDIFCLPSTSEGLGSVLLEAQAAGCAVAASKLPAIGEVIDDGTTGVLVATGQPSNWTVAMRKLMTEEDYRLTLGKSARAQFPKRFTLGHLAEHTVALYRGLAK